MSLVFVCVCVRACVCLCVCIYVWLIQDGRADVVANDAGDRVTPAVVAYRDTEQVQCASVLHTQ